MPSAKCLSVKLQTKHNQVQPVIAVSGQYGDAGTAFTAEQREGALEALIDEVESGRDVRLMCHCKPRACCRLCDLYQRRKTGGGPGGGGSREEEGVGIEKRGRGTQKKEQSGARSISHAQEG